MIDQLIGRPNPSWKRAQVFLVVLFWLSRILKGDSNPPRVLWFPRFNRILKRFTPWQIIVSALTAVYAVRNFDKILGLNAPEPLAHLYTPSYYRATWIVTGLDAGFATAMTIRPKWLRDICSIVFSVYYIIYANEADEKLRRFRAVPTVEMLRTVWEKTSNPYLRLVTRLPRLSIRRKVLLPRPKLSSYDRPITAYLFFAPPESELPKATELILDFPGGGFVAMNPEHHEERLRMWAVKTGRPVLAIDYGKAPEYPYPFASDEAFDVYRLLVETAGAAIGMSGRKISIIVSGDSAGATLAVNAVVKVLEYNQIAISSHVGTTLSVPTAVVLNYPALDFNFTSWMSADNLRVLHSEKSSGNLQGVQDIAEQKNHLQHVSPLSMVRERRSTNPRKHLKRRESWKDVQRNPANGEVDSGTHRVKHTNSSKVPIRNRRGQIDDRGTLADAESGDDEDWGKVKEEDRPIKARVRYSYDELPRNETAWEKQQEELSVAVAEADTKATLAVAGKEPDKGTKKPIGTMLAMTSRTGYFQDRIISPSMMRAMAILYIGPYRNPDFLRDYHISPILTPAHLLSQFPPLLMQCGERDPFVDDTVVFAGRVREAKRARKNELDLLLGGKSARFGEDLRMSNVEAPFENRTLAQLKKERDKLAGESDFDWVQMVIFSDWSHGYLQMPTLMSEAKAVIDEIGEWIDDTFSRYSGHGSDDSGNTSNHSTPQRLSPKSHSTRSHSPRGRATDPSPMTSETETETDSTAITFVPKKHYNDSGRTSLRHSITGSPLRSPKEISSTTSTISTSDDAEVDKFEENDRKSNSPPTPVEGSKGSGPRVAGQKISEIELMRRRRLLDSHIFE